MIPVVRIHDPVLAGIYPPRVDSAEFPYTVRAKEALVKLAFLFDWQIKPQGGVMLPVSHNSGCWLVNIDRGIISQLIVNESKYRGGLSYTSLITD